MNIEEVFEIKYNKKIARDVYKMVLSGNTELITRPGQFVNIRVPGFYLRRPISVCDYEDGELTIIYKVVGNGTDYLSKMICGGRLDILVGLGNGFDISSPGNSPLLIGGGVGLPPMYGLAKRLVLKGCSVNVVMGFASKEDMFYREEFETLNKLSENGSCNVYIATVDGSAGRKGFVTDCFDDISEISCYYACGPVPMLKAIAGRLSERTASDNKKIIGQLSFEERMGCGFGACVGCSLETKSGTKKVCKDGPVFSSDDVYLI